MSLKINGQILNKKNCWTIILPSMKIHQWFDCKRRIIKQRSIYKYYDDNGLTYVFNLTKGMVVLSLYNNNTVLIYCIYLTYNEFKYVHNHFTT
jgi:hypothetical protein